MLIPPNGFERIANDNFALKDKQLNCGAFQKRACLLQRRKRL